MDNMLLIGLDSKFIKKLVTDLNAQFSLKNLGELNYFLVLEARKSDLGCRYVRLSTKLIYRIEM